mgnify:CR=1 FL=1
MTEVANKIQITELLALQDEITNISRNIKQLIEGLHASNKNIGNLKQLANTLTDKVGQLNSNVDGYTPDVVDNEGVSDYVKASYIDAENDGKQERLVPTPENYKEFQNMKPVVAKSKPELVKPSIYDLQQKQLDNLKYNTEEAKSDNEKEVKAMMDKQKELQQKSLKLRKEAADNPGVSVKTIVEPNVEENQEELARKARQLTSKKNIRSRKSNNKSPIKETPKKRVQKKQPEKKKWFGGNG